MVIYRTLDEFRKGLEYERASSIELERRLQLSYPQYIEDLEDLMGEEPDEPTRGHFQEVLRTIRADQQRAQGLLADPVALLDQYISELESFAQDTMRERHSDMRTAEHYGHSTQREHEQLASYLENLYAEITQHRQDLARLKGSAI